MLLPLLLVLASLPFYVFAIGAAFWFLFALHNDVQTRRWPRTMGRIVQARLVSNRSAGSRGFHWKVRYSFVIPDEYPNEGISRDEDDAPDDPGPRPREVESVESSRFRYRSRRACERILERFRVGQPIEVSFDPLTPRDSSTLRPGPRADLVYPGALAIANMALALDLTFAALHTIRV